MPWYEGLYEVSNEGRLRSRHYGKERVLSPSKLRGYSYVCLSSDGASHSFLLHRLVLRAFVGEPLFNQEACHNNGNKDDNSLANLRWDTRSANQIDALKHGTWNNGNAGKTHCKREHEFTPENTLIRAGVRQCRTCVNQRKRKKR